MLKINDTGGIKRFIVLLWTIFCGGGAIYCIRCAVAYDDPIIAMYYFVVMLVFLVMGAGVWVFEWATYSGEVASSFMDGNNVFLDKEPPILSPYRATLENGDAMSVIDDLLEDVYPDFPDRGDVSLLLAEAYVACGFSEYGATVIENFFQRPKHERNEDSVAMLMLYAEIVGQTNREACVALLQQEVQSKGYEENQIRRLKEKKRSLSV